MKKNKFLLIVVFFCASLLQSCHKWLDIKPKLETERDELFSSEQGFKDALSGCYSLLKDRELYGNALTMTSLEYMAQHWMAGSNDQEFRRFNYQSEVVKTTFKAVYNKLYTVIAQANDMLYYLELNGHEVIAKEDNYKLLKGEVLAIRAFCHFEILRIFGQVPNKATIEVDLPYAERASEDAPFKYDFDGYVDKVLVDFANAEKLLQESDPLLRYTFNELNDPVKLKKEGHTDFGDGFRRVRLNYWAVKALTARVHSYIGDKTSAYEYATAVINGKVTSGQPAISISNAKADFENEAYTLPSETLFALHVYNLETQIKGQFDGINALSAYNDLISFRKTIYSSSTSDIRFRTFAEQLSSSGGTSSAVQVISNKYKQSNAGKGLNGNESVSAMNNFITMQMIPIIRLGELYLIAAESAPSVAESNRLMREYKSYRDITHRDYNKLAERTADVLTQYNGEFWAEGQMFYFYKKTKAESMVWGFRELTEEDYIVPLPDGEF